MARQLRILPIHPDIFSDDASFFLIQDLKSMLYFVWRQTNEESAQDTLETLQGAWDADELERVKDLHVNFVDRIDRTLVRPS